MLTLGVFEKKWQGKIHAQLQTLVDVDGQILYSGAGSLFGRDMLGIVLNNSGKNLEFIGNGKVLRVSVQKKLAVFSLAGADKAAAYLQRCILKRLPSA